MVGSMWEQSKKYNRRWRGDVPCSMQHKLYNDALKTDLNPISFTIKNKWMPVSNGVTGTNLERKLP